ncbi:MAG: PIN domain-containing protein [Candidatus Woesearchaeota archaeon]|jgi:predicted nucleic acid-binding protein
MKLVIDANILFSILIKKSKTEELLYDPIFEFYAPEFLFEEFQKYEKLILSKTQRNHMDFQHILFLLKSKIFIISYNMLFPFLDDAKKITPDLNDVQYFAAALQLKCSIWSNDKNLKIKQNVICVYTSEDLLTIFFS